jgi:Mn2+/Fe2+ NRAMP family transporter
MINFFHIIIICLAIIIATVIVALLFLNQSPYLWEAILLYIGLVMLIGYTGIALIINSKKEKSRID